MNHPKRILFQEHGQAQQVATVAPYPTPTPGAGEVLLALRATPVHPSDFGIFNGSYGRLPEAFPANAGREGVGEIVALGDGVDPALMGKPAAMPANAAWQEAATVRTEQLHTLPEGIDPHQASMAFINPATAYRLLHDFIKLQSGDWIVQNAGNSAVATCVTQIAKKLGINTLSIARKEEHIEVLKEMGATEVALEGSDYVKEFAKLKPKLALNSVGGESAIKLSKMLAYQGVHVTFGGMTGDPVRFPTRHLIFNDVTLKGFWLDAWLRNADNAAFQTMYEEIFNCIQDGTLHMRVDSTYSLESVLDALDKAASPHRSGKTLLTSHWKPTPLKHV